MVTAADLEMRRVGAASAARFARRAFASRRGARALQVIDTHCGGSPRAPWSAFAAALATMMDMRAHVMVGRRPAPAAHHRAARLPVPERRLRAAAERGGGDRAAYGVVIGEQNKIYPLFSPQHICTATALAETGMAPMVERSRASASRCPRA